jgi:hypothetical protein
MRIGQVFFYEDVVKRGDQQEWLLKKAGTRSPKLMTSSSPETMTAFTIARLPDFFFLDLMSGLFEFRKEIQTFQDIKG